MGNVEKSFSLPAISHNFRQTYLVGFRRVFREKRIDANGGILTDRDFRNQPE